MMLIEIRLEITTQISEIKDTMCICKLLRRILSGWLTEKQRYEIKGIIIIPGKLLRRITMITTKRYRYYTD